MKKEQNKNNFESAILPKYTHREEIFKWIHKLLKYPQRRKYVNNYTTLKKINIF